MGKRVGIGALVAALLLVGAGIILALSSGIALHRGMHFRDITHFGQAYTSTEEQTFVATGAPILSLAGHHGAVTISRGDDNAKVVIRATKRAGSQETLGRLRVTATQEGDRITIEEQWNDTPVIFGFGTAIDYDITLPMQATVAALHTANGPVSVTGIAGALHLETSNGAVTVRDFGSDVTAHTTNGHMTFADGRGTIQASTTNGTIEAQNVQTTGMTLHSSNGRITFTGTLMPGSNSNIETSNGSVSVALPPDSGFTLDARTSNRSVNVAFPLIAAADGGIMRERNTVRGTVGTPDRTLTIHTTNGSITVGKQESR